jgi:hypothetical protein
MQVIERAYRMINLLSLDVAAGAVISSIFLCHWQSCQPSMLTLTGLGISVWLIYTADHLLDAKSLNTPALTRRHRFHQRNFNWILIVFCVVCVCDAFIVWQLPREVLMSGMLLGTLVLLYFLLQTRMRMMKEFAGAFLYCAGVVLPVSPELGNLFKGEIGVVAPLFMLITLSNLILFSFFDQESDRIQRHPSLVAALGSKGTWRLLCLLFVVELGYATTLLLIKPEHRFEILILFVMVVTLIIIFINENWFSGKDRYRLAGDAIFIFPVFFFYWQ